MKLMNLITEKTITRLPPPPTHSRADLLKACLL